MDDYSDVLPKKNGDGLDIIEPTTEQKYRFDKDGWLLVPGVLSEQDIKEMREFCIQLHLDSESLPEHERTPLAGPTQKLIDHPLVVGMLNEFMANPRLSSPNCYGFSLAANGLWYRTAPNRRNEGKREARQFSPHNGNGLYRLPGDAHYYNAFPGKANSPHTRVIWELNPVKHKQGGTLLVTGSHKAVYTAPDEIQDPDSSIWTTYSCPAGSVLFFAEATTHSAYPWINEEKRPHCHCQPLQLRGWRSCQLAETRPSHTEIHAPNSPLTLFRERFAGQKCHQVRSISLATKSTKDTRAQRYREKCIWIETDRTSYS